MAAATSAHVLPSERSVTYETGDRKDGAKTAHVAPQYLGSVGKIANGIVSVTSLWADERVHYPLHVVPYTPAARLPLGKKDPTLRTKPQLAVGLVSRAQDLGVPFRAVVADCIYGESAAFEGTLWGARLPYVLAVRPSRGTWGPEDAAHTPEDAAREVLWTSAAEPGGWTAVERRFRDGLFSPLVYQTGYETAAQHQCGTGGIYCYVCADPQVALQVQSGWIAQVEPCGWQVVYGDTLQAAAVHVLGMEAWCMGWLPSVAPTCRSPHGHHRVSSGHLVSSPACDRFRELVPICDELPLSARRAPFRFHIRDGQVFFTKRS